MPLGHVVMVFKEERATHYICDDFVAKTPEEIAKAEEELNRIGYEILLAADRREREAKRQLAPSGARKGQAMTPDEAMQARRWKARGYEYRICWRCGQLWQVDRSTRRDRPYECMVCWYKRKVKKGR